MFNSYPHLYQNAGCKQCTLKVEGIETHSYQECSGFFGKTTQPKVVFGASIGRGPGTPSHDSFQNGLNAINWKSIPQFKNHVGLQ
jgi:hypothetical protein